MSGSNEFKTLMVFDIEKKLLLEALLHISNISMVSVVGVLHYDDKRFGGIFINYSSEQKDTQYKTILHTSFSINDEQMINCKFPAEFPLFLVSCHPNYINSINTLPPKRDGTLNVSFVQVEVNPDTVESQMIVYGEHNKMAGCRVVHPKEKLSVHGQGLFSSEPGNMFL